MVMEPLPRRAQILVVSPKRTAGELASYFGSPPDRAVSAGERQAHVVNAVAAESTWELHQAGSNSSDISLLIEALYARALPFTRQLKDLSSQDCKVILRIVLYLSANDEHGAGFVISQPILEWMNLIGIDFVDVDQYVVE
jgi:Domain of unknown function (DUF4279)